MILPAWVPLDKEIYLFDVDGVLLHTAERFSNRYEKKVGKPGLLTVFFKGVFQQCLIGEADLKEELEKHLDEWEWEGSVDELLTFWFDGESHVNDETVAIIQALREEGKKCYLITNQEKYRAEHLSELLDTATIADGFIASSHIGVKKPEKKFYTTILERVGFDGDFSKVFYVDDEPENIVSAQELGIHAFYYEA